MWKNVVFIIVIIALLLSMVVMFVAFLVSKKVILDRENMSVQVVCHFLFDFFFYCCDFFYFWCSNYSIVTSCLYYSQCGSLLLSSHWSFLSISIIIWFILWVSSSDLSLVSYN